MTKTYRIDDIYSSKNKGIEYVWFYTGRTEGHHDIRDKQIILGITKDKSTIDRIKKDNKAKWDDTFIVPPHELMIDLMRKIMINDFKKPDYYEKNKNYYLKLFKELDKLKEEYDNQPNPYYV
jgi:hypothetical protein|tara:strand:- start:1484 stop:1849 length:366 start_codon:yes stop_codon:yes gene_type:complete